jgi:hypothetical protein
VFILTYDQGPSVVYAVVLSLMSWIEQVATLLTHSGFWDSSLIVMISALLMALNSHR